MSALSNVTQTAITQLVAAGSSEYIALGNFVPTDAAVVVTTVNPSSLVLQVDYSADGAGAADASSIATAASSTAGIYVLPVSITADYPFVRLTWVSGTADSVDATFEFNQAN